MVDRLRAWCTAHGCADSSGGSAGKGGPCRPATLSLGTWLSREGKRLTKLICAGSPTNPQRDAGKFRKYEEWILDTEGINLEQVLAFEGVDPRRTMSNSIIEVLEVLGIEVRWGGAGLGGLGGWPGRQARRDVTTAVHDGVHTGVWRARRTVRSA